MNNDLISREALKKAFTEECCGCCDNCSHCMTGYKCELIDNAPTVEPTFGLFRAMLCETCQSYATNKAIAKLADEHTRPQDQWIPVSERLPEEKINSYTTDFDEVLCTTDWGEVVALKFGTPILHHKPHFWLGGAIMDEHIIAWQYKPEPYKEGGAE